MLRAMERDSKACVTADVRSGIPEQQRSQQIGLRRLDQTGRLIRDCNACYYAVREPHLESLTVNGTFTLRQSRTQHNAPLPGHQT